MEIAEVYVVDCWPEEKYVTKDVREATAAVGVVSKVRAIVIGGEAIVLPNNTAVLPVK